MTMPRRDLLQHPYRLLRDFDADAVAGQHRDEGIHEPRAASNRSISPSLLRKYPSSSRPFRRQWRAKGSMGNCIDAPVGRLKVVDSRSISTSAPGCSSSHCAVGSSTTTGSKPFLSELPRKISAI